MYLHYKRRRSRDENHYWKKKSYYCVLFSLQLACITASIQLVENSKEMLFILFCSDNLGHGYLMPRGRSTSYFKSEKGSTEAKLCHAINFLWKKVLFLGSLLETHQSAMGIYFFPVSLVTFPEVFTNLKSSQFLLHF